MNWVRTTYMLVLLLHTHIPPPHAHSTWRNAQLGENIIQQLETKSQEMTQEMNTTIGEPIFTTSGQTSHSSLSPSFSTLSEKLTEEASALEVEKGRKAVCP